MAATKGLSGGVFCAVSGIVTGGAVVTACENPTCDLGSVLRGRAGASARDCGHGQPGDAPARAVGDAGQADAGAGDAGLGDAGLGDAHWSAVDECVTRAFLDAKPFYAEYDRPAVGPGLVFGIAGDGSGRVWLMSHNDHPSGGAVGASILASECHDPSVDTSPDRDPDVMAPIKCGSATSLGQICGNRR